MYDNCLGDEHCECWACLEARDRIVLTDALRECESKASQIVLGTRQFGKTAKGLAQEIVEACEVALNKKAPRSAVGAPGREEKA